MSTPAPQVSQQHETVPRTDEGTNVIIVDPPRMNLLGLILGSILGRNLTDPGQRRRLARLSGSVAVKAGEMAVTLTFEQGRVRVSRGANAPPRAAVSGSLEALMNLALGGGLVGPWLAGKLRTRGSLLFLLRLRPLLVAS